MSKPKTFQEAVELVTLAEKDSYVPDASNKILKRKAVNVNESKKIRVSEENIRTSTACVTCGKFHHGECMYGKRVCFSCGQPGHMSKECKTRFTCYSCGAVGHRSNECPKKDLVQPKLLERPNGKKPEVPKTKGRVFQMTAEEA
ncbi:zinc finger protein GIS2-like [Cynara cardunculus var. scolymus]|uniref:zinc finger protein GIS2-like n=1 Tax=Cynara cardunculus var. scolymus TaxID=59895 RepID=UPI000D62A281|nr:zinc finger protein GIS2-like [Cynara cardunculus var. scolymus]